MQNFPSYMFDCVLNKHLPFSSKVIKPQLCAWNLTKDESVIRIFLKGSPIFPNSFLKDISDRLFLSKWTSEGYEKYRIHPISWCWNFVARRSLRIVSGDSPNFRKLGEITVFFAVTLSQLALIKMLSSLS